MGMELLATPKTRMPLAAAVIASIAACLPVRAEEAGKTWSSALYGPGWSATPPLSFAKDPILQDFSYAGYAKGEKPIPDLSTARRFDVVADFGADAGGTRDSTEAIQKAIAAAEAAGGGVVVLPAGTFRVQPRTDQRYALCIRKNGVVLRGAGPDKTFLLNTSTEMREKVIVLFQAPSSASWDRQEGSPTLITVDLMGPSVEIPVADASGFKAGDWVIVRSDPNPDWVMDHHEDDWLGEEKKIGSIQYLRRIVSVDAAAKVLTIDVPTRYALKTRDRSEVYRKAGMLENVGLEQLAIGNIQHPGKDGWKNLDFAAPEGGYTKRLAESRGLPDDFAKTRQSAYDVHNSYAVTLSNVVDGWIRNVRSFRHQDNSAGCHLLSNGIRLRECRGVTVEGCDFQHPQYGGGGGNGYMYRLDDSNECLIRDCRAESSRHGFSISGMACSGNVVFRCLDKDTARQTGASGNEETEGRSSDHHQYFSHSNLFDNCTADNSWFEARDRFYKQLSRPRHNLTSAHTVYWNTRGLANSFHPFVVWSQQADYGYVIGTRGPVNAVRTDGNFPGRKSHTDPVDFVEGVGKGDTLSPTSLFEDQRRRRLGEGAGR